MRLILAKADDPEFRRAWITRITDHDGIGDSEGGIRKWYKLSEAAGLDPADVASLRYVLPGVRFAVDAYLHLCATRPLTDAVASSLTELFAPVLMADRIVVLEKLYPWLDSRGLDYFRGRLVQAPRDSDFGLQYVVAHCTTRESQDRAADALTHQVPHPVGPARRDSLRLRFTRIFAAAMARSAKTLMNADDAWRPRLASRARLKFDSNREAGNAAVPGSRAGSQ